jgi:hypothetical protein
VAGLLARWAWTNKRLKHEMVHLSSDPGVAAEHRHAQIAKASDLGLFDTRLGRRGR